MTSAAAPRPSDRWGRAGQVLRYHLSIEKSILWTLVAFLAAMIVIPLVAIAYSSLKDVRPDDPTFLGTSGFTLDNVTRAFVSDNFIKVTLVTTAFAVGSSLLAVLLGGLLAFVTTRTNAFLKGLIGALVLYQLAMPELMYPIVWTFLLGPDLGVINLLWQALPGVSEPLLSAYSLPAMIVVESFLLLPLVYLFMVPALSAMDRSLEEAAEVSGASRIRVMRDIVVKLAMPAIVATSIIVLMRSWEAFEVPWFLGLREKNLTYSTELFFRTITPPSDTGLISAFALPMLAVALLMVWYYNRFNKAAKSYATMTGKNYRPTPLRLNATMRSVVTGSAIVILFLGVVLPFLMLVWMSVQPFYRTPSVEALEFMTLDAYRKVFDSPAVLEGFRNSFLVGVGSTILILVVASLSGWFVVHGRQRGGRLLDVLTFVPLSFPNVVIAICLLWIFLLLPDGLRGSYLGLILAYFILFIALAARNINPRLMQFNKELQEAAAVSGAGFLTSFRTIVVPLLLPALFASGLYVMSWAFKELEASILLSGPQTKTATVVIYDQSGLASTSEVAAIGVVSMAAIALVILMFQVAARRFNVRGF